MQLNPNLAQQCCCRHLHLGVSILYNTISNTKIERFNARAQKASSINWQGFAFFNYIPASGGQTTYRWSASLSHYRSVFSKEDECHRRMIPPPHLLHHSGNKTLREISAPGKTGATRRW